MLFNSFAFILLFLPVTLALYVLAVRVRALGVAFAIVAAASLVFYAWWNPLYLVILCGSVLVNFALGETIRRRRADGRMAQARAALVAGIAAQLALIGYFKYWHFAVATAAQITGLPWAAEKLVLPLGISFFTFTQIAFLVDVYRGYTQERNLVRFALFILFFPHLIAGPIVHHREIIPGFLKVRPPLPMARLLAVGGTIFLIGLAKKVLLADSLAPFNDGVFALAAQGKPVDMLSAWGAMLGYTFQLYFDFSGYSDMAVGLAYMFGVRFPMNFFSPYRARNIVEFWRGWHITLSRFLRDYVYLPLGGNRCGPVRRHVNILATMALGGLWHGAGWTFILWGVLHGVFIVVVHLWHGLRVRLGWGAPRRGGAGRLAATALTFLVVALLWVLFRAETLAAAEGIYRGLLGQNGLVLPQRLADMLPLGAEARARWSIRIDADLPLTGLALHFALCAALLALVWLAPNSSELTWRFRPVLAEDRRRLPPPLSGALRRLRWVPAPAVAILCGVLFVAVLLRIAGGGSSFLYYDF